MMVVEAATAPTTKNPAAIALGVIGALLFVVGGIVALVQKGAAETAARGSDYLNVLQGGSPGLSAPDYGGVWIGVVLAALGALMLVGLLIVVAARPRETKQTPTA